MLGRSCVLVWALAALIGDVPAVEFPGPAPGIARAGEGGGAFVLSNDVLAVRWEVEAGSLRLAAFENKLTGESFSQSNTEIFRLSSQDSPAGTDRKFFGIRLTAASVDVLASSDQSAWVTLASFGRGDFPGDPAEVRLGKMDSNGQGVDFGAPGAAGESHFDDLQVQDGAGVTLLEDHFDELSAGWTVDESLQPGTQIYASNGVLVVRAPGNCHAFIQRSVPPGGAGFVCSLEKFTDQRAGLGSGIVPALGQWEVSTGRISRCPQPIQCDQQPQR